MTQFNFPHEVHEQLISDALARQYESAKSKELSPALSTRVDEVIKEVPEEGRIVIAQGVQQYSEGIKNGTLVANAKTREQAQKRLLAFFNPDALDETTRSYVKIFVKGWYQGGQPESEFRQEHKSSGFGLVARLESTLAMDIRKQERAGNEGQLVDYTANVAKAIIDSLEKP